MSDIVYISDLRFSAILGVLPEERVTPQQVVVSLVLTTDTRVAANSKNLADTVDYAAIAETVREHTIAAECLLVETLAEQLAELVLRTAGVSAVEIDVGKPDALPDARQVGVRIYRKRD